VPAEAGGAARARRSSPVQQVLADGAREAVAEAAARAVQLLQALRLEGVLRPGAQLGEALRLRVPGRWHPFEEAQHTLLQIRLAQLIGVEEKDREDGVQEDDVAAVAAEASAAGRGEVLEPDVRGPEVRRLGRPEQGAERG